MARGRSRKCCILSRRVCFVCAVIALAICTVLRVSEVELLHNREPPTAPKFRGQHSTNHSFHEYWWDDDGNLYYSYYDDGVERRMDPDDGGVYSLEEFRDYYRDEWQKRWDSATPLAERRIDADYGGAFTEQEFRDYYGDTWQKHWDSAERFMMSPGKTWKLADRRDKFNIQVDNGTSITEPQDAIQRVKEGQVFQKDRNQDDTSEDDDPQEVIFDEKAITQAPVDSETSGTTLAGLSPKTPLLVALAAGLRQLEDVLVVVNSALAHAAQPERLHFRIITMAAEASEVHSKLQARLPAGAELQTVAFDAWVPRVSRLLGGKSSSRAELFDVLNFAAFYLHELFPAAGRVLYLDVDVVVLADIAKELSEHDMKGQPMAAARDCSQRIGKYVDMDRLKKRRNVTAVTASLHYDKKICVVNRGVVLVDVIVWAKSKITETIEQLVEAHLKPGVGPLWRSGVSQPPFLLAAGKHYLDLGPEYNVRGLGRGDISPEEIQYYKKNNLWSPYFDAFVHKCEFECCPGCKGWAMSPYIAPNADRAKVLHFNGRLKPSKAGRRSSNSLPQPSLTLSKEEKAARELRPLCSCGPQCVRECAGLWWKYLPPAN